MYIQILGTTIGNDGVVCPNMCPTICTKDQLLCHGGKDANGCKVAGSDKCISITGNCPAVCPIICPTDHMICEGEKDANGCALPGTCVPISSEYIFLENYIVNRIKTFFFLD